MKFELIWKYLKNCPTCQVKPNLMNRGSFQGYWETDKPHYMHAELRCQHSACSGLLRYDNYGKFDSYRLLALINGWNNGCSY